MTSPTGADNSRRSVRSGFSLIELILVLLLLGLGASMIFPMMGRFSRGRTSTDTAAHMLAIIQHAQDQAAITGAPYRLHWNEEAGSYWLEASVNGRFSRISSEIGRTFDLPDQMTLSVRGTAEQLANGYIQFDADGGHDVLVIHLTDGNGKEVVLGCSSPSEPYRIGDPSEVR
jgi:type II secretion system protein H